MSDAASQSLSDSNGDWTINEHFCFTAVPASERLSLLKQDQKCPERPLLTCRIGNVPEPEPTSIDGTPEKTEHRPRRAAPYVCVHCGLSFVRHSRYLQHVTLHSQPEKQRDEKAQNNIYSDDEASYVSQVADLKRQ